jgi:hypothetical protein
MVRRFLWLAAILLFLLSAPACSKAKSTAPAVPDPDGNYVPSPGGAKPG